MAYAEVPDLVARWHPLTTDEQAKAAILLGDASFWLRVWVRKSAGDIAPEIEAGREDIITAAKLLTVAMVKRAMLAEDGERPGVASVQETAGMYSEQVVYRNPDGNLYLYESELDSLVSLMREKPADAVSYTSPGL